jgi:hypothetical protein
VPAGGSSWHSNAQSASCRRRVVAPRPAPNFGALAAICAANTPKRGVVDNFRHAITAFDIISDMSWAELASRQDGVVTRRQLYGLEVTGDQVDRLLRSRALVRIGWGVFLVRGAPLTYRARLWLAVLSSGGTLAFASAAHLWGVIPQIPEYPRHRTPPTSPSRSVDGFGAPSE